MGNFDTVTGADLKAAFEDAVLDWPNVTGKTMFGCPSYLAGGTTFAVLVTDGVALTRLPADQREEVAESFQVGPFQAGEQTVTKWTQITLTDSTEVDGILPYVRASYENALEDPGGNP